MAAATKRLALLAALLLGAAADPGRHANPNIRFGRPAPAGADPGDREAYLVDRPQYVL